MRPGGDRPDQRGAVTAELAMGLPLLMAVTVGLVWLLSVGADQVRTVDAARETARSLARGDDEAAALGRGREVAPPGSQITVVRTGEEIRVTVTGSVHGPGGLFGALPGAQLHAEAVALDESETSGVDP